MIKKLSAVQTQIGIIMAAAISGILIQLTNELPIFNPCSFFFGEPEYPTED